MLYHVAVCLQVRSEGGDDFQTAVKRAGMMERNEPGAWGSL